MILRGVHFAELGMAEAVWIIELDRLPLVVGIDAQGNDIFEAVKTNAARAFEQYTP